MASKKAKGSKALRKPKALKQVKPLTFLGTGSGAGKV